MPRMLPDGSFEFSMEEYQQMQSGKSGDKSGQKSGDGDNKGSWIDKWKDRMTPQKKNPPSGNNNPNQNPGNGGKQQQQQQQPQGLTREALMEAAKKLNFFEPTGEQLKKIQEGDMSAFVEANQDAFRRLFVDATLTSDTLVQGNQASSKQEFQRMIQEQLGSLESAKTIRDKTGDFFTAPGGDLMVSALTRQFKDANPDASAAEIGEMVSGYLTDFSSNFGQKETTPNAREVQLQEAQKSATDF